MESEFQDGSYVTINLTPESSMRFGDFTFNHLDETLAIVLSGEVILQATIVDVIHTSISIRGLSEEEIQYFFGDK